MKSRVFRTFVLPTSSITFCILSLLAFQLSAYGQWRPDSTENTPVCDTVGQQDYPQGCTDGDNGAIFVWQDARKGVAQIYAQHIGLNGHPRWNKNGVQVASYQVGDPSMTNPIITTDDSGGAYVVWFDSRNVNSNGICLFAQHLLADGSLGYPDTGLAVAIGLNGCTKPVICHDGLGNAYVAWEDNRVTDPSSRPDIWMNKLWPHGVKYGLTTTGTKGTLSKVNIGTFGHPKYVYYFHDTSAHFKSYMVNLYLTIPGEGTYQIDEVLADSQVELKTYPAVGTYAYTVGNLTGLAIDTMVNKQTAPALVNDGKGGCFIAWTTGATSPNSIYGDHLDSTCTAQWDPAPKPGFQFYTDIDPSYPSRNVSLNRDSNQLILAWEVTNPNNNSQEVYAQRMRCNTIKDSAFVWGGKNSAVDVSSDQSYNQTNPQIFGDDSVVLGAKGLLVPFMDEEPEASDNYDIAMVRVLGDGGRLLPTAGTGFWFYEQKPHMHNNFQAVKITDTTNKGSNTGLLAVWADAWDTPNTNDTMIYVQRMDRTGRKYFPTPGTRNTWGQPISGDSPTKQWSAKQPCIIPRTDGAIIGWTDLRGGTGAIYCQLILMDGTLWIPLDTTQPTLKVLSTTPPDNDSACNSQCTNVLATDTGSLISGIDTLIPVGMTNMQLAVASFAKGAKSVPFSVCVIDSLLNGSGTIMVEDTALNASSMSFTYCTIADTKAPLITVDTFVSPRRLYIQIADDQPWDRGLKNIMVSNILNIKFSDSSVKINAGTPVFSDTATIIDTTLTASFSFKAADAAGNVSTTYNFFYSPSKNGVAEIATESIAISVYPNPTSGDATIMLNGTESADVTVSDVLGRMVDQFRVVGSHEWQSSSLAPGIYIIRALIGGHMVCKRIVRE